MGNRARIPSDRLGARRPSAGCWRALHGERLRVDVVRDDVVRVKISRGGVVRRVARRSRCASIRWRSAVDFDVERDDGVVRLRTSALVVSLGLDPFRLDVHRADGSPVVETALDADGRHWAYATLNDAFTVRRRCRARGRDLRPRREDRARTTARAATSRCGTPTCSTRTRRASSPRGRDRRPAGGPRAAPSSTRTTSRSRSSTTTTYTGGDDGRRRSSTTATAATTTSRTAEEYRDPLRRRPVHRVRLRRAGDAGDPRGVHLADRPHRAAAAVVARLPPVPLVRLHAGRGRGARRSATASCGIPCDALWLDIEYMDGYRVFTWDDRGVPGRPPAMLERLREQGFRVITIVDPGREARARLPGVRRGGRARRAVPDRGRRRLHRPGLARRHRVPRLRHRGGARLVGRAQRRARAVRAGRHLERHERAGHRERSRPTRMRFDHGRALARALPQPVRAADGDGHASRACCDAMPDLRTFVLSRAGFAGIQRYAANWMGDNLSRWDHLRVSMPMASGLGVSGQAFVGADVGGFAGDSNAELFLRWMQYGALTPFCRNHSEIGNVDQYAWSWGDVDPGPRARGDRAALPAAAVPLRRVPARLRDRRAGAAAARVRPPGRPAVRDIDDEYLFGPRPAGRAGRRGRRRPRARSTCPRATGTTGTPASASSGGRFVARADADGPHPALRPRRRGHPDVAGGAAVDGRTTTRRRSSCTCSCRATDGTHARCCRRTTGSPSPPATARATAPRSR